jgi:hypothetical protein
MLSDSPRLDVYPAHGSCCALRCRLRPATHATPKGTHIWPACTGADRRTVPKGSCRARDPIRTSSDSLSSLFAVRCSFSAAGSCFHASLHESSPSRPRVLPISRHLRMPLSPSHSRTESRQCSSSRLHRPVALPSTMNPFSVR